MSTFILDMGSGNSNTSFEVGKAMIDAVASVDGRKHEVILKYQMWTRAMPQGANEWLDWYLFKQLYEYGRGLGYKVTSSVFDYNALVYLLTFDIPFVKLANRPDTWGLLGDVPRRIPVYISNYLYECGFRESGLVIPMAVVSKYPASLREYEMIPNLGQYKAISDHTPGWELWDKYHPSVLEKHFVLERGGDNPDAGSFACTPEELKEILG
jgi:sialic acid synthase SpsE